MTSQLEQLRALGTVVVADTGDIDAIRRYQPTDATTNPSLLLAAASMPEYAHLVADAVAFGGGDLTRTMDKLAVSFGVEIVGIVRGLVSTEVDARLSFDTAATVAKARELIRLYEQAGVGKDRVLIKVASTWEGVQAARVLEREGIRVNMTLMFALCQAVAAAEAGATLVSPFVGRILDWHKEHGLDGAVAADDDPGVKSVREIWTYFAKFGYKTIVMGASFRNKNEIVALAGCPKLTIGPKFLAELAASTAPVARRLDPEQARAAPLAKIDVDERRFRWMLNEDAMATEKLAQGIRAFAADTVKLEAVVLDKIRAYHK